jgi:hypothetical protein
VVPLDGDALALVRTLMQAPPVWCSFLFHRTHWPAGRKSSQGYGCVGDFKKSRASHVMTPAVR